MTVARLSGERIHLRPVEVDDVTPRYVAWMNDPDVTRHLESRFTSYTAEDLARYVTTVGADASTHFFAIVLHEGDRHIGNIKLGPVEQHHRRGDIGIIIGEQDCWGRGYASEAIQLITTWALGTLGLHKVTAGAYDVNAGSVGAFQRAGFVVEAVRPDHYLQDGRWVSAVLLGRLADAGGT